MKSIFNFEVTKDYLRYYIDSLPRKGWGEIQRWAEHLNVQASFISQILSGLKSLNVDQALTLSSLLGLTGLELDYFMLLIEMERAGHHKTKQYYLEKLKAIKTESQNLGKRLPKDKVLTAEQKSIFYSSWLYSAARMLCSFPGGQTLQQMSDRLELKKDETHQILNFLCDTGLCEKKGSAYFVGARKTHLEKQSPHIRKHWMNWHIKAIQRFDHVATDEIVYSAPFTISEADFGRLREELTRFIEGFVKTIENTESEKVGLLNIDLLKIL